MEKCMLFMAFTFLSGAKSEFTEVFAAAGSQAVLPCTCGLSLSITPAIMWSNSRGTVWRREKSGLQYWASGMATRIQCPHSMFERGDCSLQISGVKESESGVYSCKVRHEVQLVETFVFLRVISVSFTPSVPIMGEPVIVSCDVNAWPHGATVHWTLNDSPYEAQKANRHPPRSILQKTTDDLVGKWTCIINYKGKQQQASAFLSVKGIIKPAENDAKVYAAMGSAAMLPCVFSNDLTPTDLQWDKLKAGFLFKPGIDRLPPSFSLSSPSTNVAWDKSATLKQVSFEDAGRYRCSGVIRRQNLTRTMQLVVAKVNTSIPSKKKPSMTLSCELTDDSDITAYEWLHVTSDLNGTESIASIHAGKTMTLINVSEENRGKWVCRFYGKGRLLGNVTHHVQLMRGRSGKESAGLFHNTATVVGLSFLLLVLLLILAQMYKNHQRRKRILAYPAMETIIHTISNEREERERNLVKK